MPSYYVNRNPQDNGDHEVHREDNCPTPAEPMNRIPLGEHNSCITAVAEAKKLYPTANGCANCSPLCHTS